MNLERNKNANIWNTRGNDIIIATMLCMPIINQLFTSFTGLGTGITVPIVLIFLLYTFFKNGVSIYLEQILLLLIIGIFFSWSFFMYGLNNPIINRYFVNFIYWGILPIVFINNKHDGERILKVVAYISLFAIILYANKEFDLLNYSENMNNSNILLPCGVAVMYQAFMNMDTKKYEKLIFILFLILYLSIIIQWSSRGALLALIVFPILIIFSRYQNVKRLIFWLLFLIFVYFALINFKYIIFWIRNFLLEFNIQVYGIERTINQILTNNITTNRDIVWGYAIDDILTMGIFGQGIGTFEIKYSFYPHNIFLQILLEFGIIIGSLFICAILLMVYKTITFEIEKSQKTFLIYLCTISIIILMFTSIYWYFVSFWMFVYEFIGIRKINFRNKKSLIQSNKLN